MVGESRKMLTIKRVNRILTTSHSTSKVKIILHDENTQVEIYVRTYINAL